MSATIQMPNVKGTKVSKICRYCGKPAVEKSSYLFDTEKVIELECGHSYSEKTHFLSAGDYEKIESLNQHHKPYGYQLDGLKFQEMSNFRCLIADEMGLGKTIQALLAILKHSGLLLPCLIVVRSQLKTQWLHELIEWTGYAAQIIGSSKEMPLWDIFKVVIVSMDTLREAKWMDTPEKIDALPFQCLIIDECQHLKNPEAKRTHAVRKLASKAKHIIALSGTPIKNHAGEYFTILNMIQPGKFPSLVSFYRNWVDVYNDGYKTRVGGIKSYRVKDFENYTADFIIRRTREKVLPDLPKIRRTYKTTNFEAGEAQTKYRVVMKQFVEEFDEDGGVTDKNMMNMLAYIAKLRHIAGAAKTGDAVDHVMTFLESTPRKIVVFHHHKDVGAMIEDLINFEIKQSDSDEIKKVKVVRLQSGDQANWNKEQTFKNDPDCRVLIASTLASGEGKNWQFCSDCLIVERQWNSVNEEQSEGRFTRPGSVAEYVDVAYLSILESVDDYFNEIVGRKREMFTRTMDHRQLNFDEQSLVREMAELLASRGRKAWRV